MKNTRIARLSALVISLLFLLSACSAGQPAGATLTDMAGREVKLTLPAKKVVALTASDCEILYAIGAGETLIGRGEYCNYPEEILDVAIVQSGNETNIEQILALSPDVVLMSVMAQSKEQTDALEKAGIAVVVSDAQTIEGIYTSITLIGTVVGKQEAAARLVSQMKNDFEALAQKVKDMPIEKSVYFEVSPLQWGLWAAGSNTFMDEIAQMLHLNNTFADVDGWGEVSQEQVIERNPDYIIAVAMYYGEETSPEKEILSRPGWEQITAVKNGTVFLIDADTITRPGPRLVEAAQKLYDYIYNASHTNTGTS